MNGCCFGVKFFLDLSNEIDDYLCHVVFQIYIGQINRLSHAVHHHLLKIYLQNHKNMKISQFFNEISLFNQQNQVGYYS